MTSEAKIWIILKEIDEAQSIAPSGEPFFVDTKQISSEITDEEKDQIFRKLEKDWKLFEIKTKPDYKKDFRYQLIIGDNEKFTKTLKEAHIKHFGSLEMLVGDNFFAVVDVSADIMNELQLTTDEEVSIDLLPSIVRFSSLMPGDGINMRDRYCEFRWKALGYLKNNGSIKIFEIEGYSHRWQSKVTVFVDRIKFARFYEKLMEVYKNRVVDGKDESKREQANIPNPVNGGKNPYQNIIDIIDILLRKIEITPRNRLTGLQLHVSETQLPQNTFGVQELQKILEALKEAGAIQAVARSVAMFSVVEPDKETLIKQREKWIQAGGNEVREVIQKIQIVEGSEIKVTKEKIAAVSQPKSLLPAELKPEITVGKLVAYSDGSIKFDDENLQIRNQLKDLCRLFMSRNNMLTTLDHIREEIIAAPKRKNTPFGTISKYVSELHTILQNYYKQPVIVNQKEEGWYFRPPK